MKIHSCVAFAVLALAGVTIAQNPKDVALLVGTWNRPKGNGTYSYTFKADGTYTGKTGALEGSISGFFRF